MRGAGGKLEGVFLSGDGDGVREGFGCGGSLRHGTPSVSSIR